MHALLHANRERKKALLAIHNIIHIPTVVEDTVKPDYLTCLVIITVLYIHLTARTVHYVFVKTLLQYVYLGLPVLTCSYSIQHHKSNGGNFDINGSFLPLLSCLLPILAFINGGNLGRRREEERNDAKGRERKKMLCLHCILAWRRGEGLKHASLMLLCQPTNQPTPLFDANVMMTNILHPLLLLSHLSTRA